MYQLVAIVRTSLVARVLLSSSGTTLGMKGYCTVYYTPTLVVVAIALAFDLGHMVPNVPSVLVTWVVPVVTLLLLWWFLIGGSIVVTMVSNISNTLGLFYPPLWIYHRSSLKALACIVVWASTWVAGCLNEVHSHVALPLSLLGFF